MDFETLLNSSKDIIKEYLDNPEKLREMQINLKQTLELIKATRETSAYIENLEKLQTLLESVVLTEDDEELADSWLIDLVKDTGKAEEYLQNAGMLEFYGAYTFIIALGKAEEYLEDTEKLKELGLDGFDIKELIIASGKVAEYLEDVEKLKELGLDGYHIKELIVASGKAEEYLEDTEKLKELGLDRYYIKELIVASGKAEEYLEDTEKLKELGLDRNDIETLIVASGKAEEYLEDTEKLKELGLDSYNIENLIVSTENVDKYLVPEEFLRLGLFRPSTELIKSSKTPEKYLLYGQDIDDEDLGRKLSFANVIKGTGEEEKYLFDGQDINNPRFVLGWANVIKATGNIDAYLTKEKIEEFDSMGYRISKDDIVELIKATGNIEAYLTKEKIEELNSRSFFSFTTKDIVELIKATENIEAYLTKEKLEEFKSMGAPFSFLKGQIVELIKATGNIEAYLTKEKIEELKSVDAYNYSLSKEDIVELIKADGNIAAYLTPEKLKELGVDYNDTETITSLIKATKQPEKYLFEGEDINSAQLSICNILKGTTCPRLTKQELQTLVNFEDECIKMVSNLNLEDQSKAIKILDRLEKSNSAELRRIKVPIATQILERVPEEYEKTLNLIENIYLTSDIPDVGKLYLVFKELHPNLLGESSKVADASVGNIPSLKNMTTSEKKSMIFSSMLMCAVESNSRNLKEYMDTIEIGDQLFNKIRTGEMKTEELKEEEKETIIKYNKILNFVYNQTAKAERENLDDISKDVEELATLYKVDKIKTKMPDRLTRLFAHRADIRSFAQAKELFENSRKIAQERNEKIAESGSIDVEEGDFIKGVRNTEYFPSMLQKGILAKDFLGRNATSDATPLDTDVEIVETKGENLRETLEKLKIADGFIEFSEHGKKFGKIMLVFSKDDFIETRNKDGEEIQENIELLKTSPNKKEIMHNRSTAYGISFGIGSENIKCIIADHYIDRLGLEIALNGFYIPIVDNDGKVIYTKDMYNTFREKMQGLSHYGERVFELDKTAKREEMAEIVELVDKSMQKLKTKKY